MKSEQLAFPFFQSTRGIRTRPPTHRRRAFDKNKTFSKTYRWYIDDSPQWRAKREEAFAARGRSCERCGDEGKQRHNPLHVHHRNYLHLGFEDVYRDLMILCETCHDYIHAVDDWLDAS